MFSKSFLSGTLRWPYAFVNKKNMLSSLRCLDCAWVITFHIIHNVSSCYKIPFLASSENVFYFFYIIFFYYYYSPLKVSITHSACWSTPLTYSCIAWKKNRSISRWGFQVWDEIMSLYPLLSLKLTYVYEKRCWNNSKKNI